MLDIDVAAALMSAVDESSKVVFVGDVNQLPSVGAGNILADLISSGEVPTVELDTVYRQGEDSTISKNANKILVGNNSLIYRNDFELIEVDNEDEAQAKILEEMKKAFNIYGSMEACLLTPLRKNKKTSVDIINKLAQSKLNPKADFKTEIKVFDKVFRLGDKVMVTKNMTKAANGDVGIILDIDEVNKSVTIDLGYDNPTTLNGRELNSLDLAYAITIHKSQGSEYGCVIISVMNEHEALLQKNLIYTAVTRAKKKVIIVGQKEAISKSIAGVQPKRYTLLNNLIKKIKVNEIKGVV